MGERLTDFYSCEYFKEYKIDPHMSIEEIKQNLTALRRLWNQRENRSPEKARLALSALDEAKQVFQSEQTKRQYDLDLERQKSEGNRSQSENDQGGGWGNRPFIDYYRSDLGISRSMSASAICSALERLRLELQSRGAYGQAFYNKMHLIQSAQEDFRDEAAKRAYDAEWDRRNTRMPDRDPDEARKKQFLADYQTAQKFFDDGFMNEARVSAEKALQKYNADVDGNGVYILLARICERDKQFDEAIRFAERAISISPDDPYPYACASSFYTHKESSGEKTRQYAKRALDCARARKDSWFTAVSLGLLSWSYWFQYPKDLDQAVQLANQSQSSRSGGDPWRNAPVVLEEKKKLDAQIAEDKRRKEEEERRRELARIDAERRAKKAKITHAFGIVTGICCVVLGLWGFIPFIVTKIMCRGEYYSEKANSILDWAWKAALVSSVAWALFLAVRSCIR